MYNKCKETLCQKAILTNQNNILLFHKNYNINDSLKIRITNKFCWNEFIYDSSWYIDKIPSTRKSNKNDLVLETAYITTLPNIITELVSPGVNNRYYSTTSSAKEVSRPKLW